MFNDMKPRQRQIFSLITLAHLLLISTACSPGSPKKKNVDLNPVNDAAPYWCQLVPQNAVPRVTSISLDLRQNRDIDIRDTLSSCEVGNDTELPLEVQLGLDGEAQFQEKQEFEHNRDATQLPPDLGRAILRTAPEAPNYTAASTFHCGKHLVWIRIIIRPVTKGRDPKKDLPELLKIAESRYASLAPCKIKP